MQEEPFLLLLLVLLARGRGERLPGQARRPLSPRQGLTSRGSSPLEPAVVRSDVSRLRWNRLGLAHRGIPSTQHGPEKMGVREEHGRVPICP